MKKFYIAIVVVLNLLSVNSYSVTDTSVAKQSADKTLKKEEKEAAKAERKDPTPVPTPEPTPVPTPEPTPVPTPEPSVQFSVFIDDSYVSRGTGTLTIDIAAKTAVLLEEDGSEDFRHNTEWGNEFYTSLTSVSDPTVSLIYGFECYPYPVGNQIALHAIKSNGEVLTNPDWTHVLTLTLASVSGSQDCPYHVILK